MRFREEELLELAKHNPDLDGVLQFKTQASRIRDQIQGYKSRWFKLKGNFLFYYRINDEGKVKELLGAFLMERFRILPEVKPNFSFSIAFQNDRERKYIFVTISNPECQRWISALKNASYEKLQTQFFLLQQRLVRITGQNPVQRHGLQRYYVDFIAEDGIEVNDGETQCKHKNNDSNTRHPLAVIQENRFHQEQSENLETNDYFKNKLYDNDIDMEKNETNGDAYKLVYKNECHIHDENSSGDTLEKATFANTNDELRNDNITLEEKVSSDKRNNRTIDLDNAENIKTVKVTLAERVSNDEEDHLTDKINLPDKVSNSDEDDVRTDKITLEKQGTGDHSVDNSAKDEVLKT